MPAIGDAFVEVRADTRRFEKDLDKGVTKSTKGATREMGGLEKATSRVGTAAKFAIAGLAVGALAATTKFAQDSIRAYSDLEESINAVTVTFGDNADEVLAMGRAAAQNLGLSNDEFNQLSVSVSAFSEKIAQSLGLDVPDVLETLTGRIADFSSVMNLEVADGFEKFRSGLAGQSEPLRIYGIDVSAATVEQVALAAGIIETGETMTESEKVTARYLTIMEQTEKVAGDFANTSEDLANSTRIANAEIENNKARTGELLVPVKRLTTAVSNLAVEGFALLATKILGATGGIDEHLASLQEYEIQAGAGTDAATLLAGAVVKASEDFENNTRGNERNQEATEALTDEILGLVGATDLSAEQAENLLDKMDFLTETMGLSEDAALILTDALENKLTLAQADAEHAAADSIITYQELDTATGDLELATGDLADEEEELAEKVLTTSELLQERQDQIRANLDPLFALSEATRAQAEAEAAVAAALLATTEGSPEHILALEDLAEANLKLKEAEDDVKVTTDITRDAFIDQQVALGLTRAEAILLADQFAILEAFKFSNKTIRISEITTAQTAVSGRAHGGPVTGGTPYMVGEVGPEIFVPKVAGNIIPNDQITTGGITVGSINVSMSGGGSREDANMVADAIEERLDRLSRARVVR